MIEYLFVILFCLDSILHIYGILKESKNLIKFSKPLLMPLLALYYAFGTFAINQFDVLIVFALIFGALGDTFLLSQENEKYFLIGMVAFLLGHVFYIISFSLYLGGDILRFPVYGFLLVIPVIVLVIIAFPKFKKGLGSMKIPVFVYMGVIILMHVFALLRLSKLPGLYCPCFFFVYLGSFLFILSDSIIAIDQFGESKIKNMRLYIMITYILAQFFIVQGIILTGILFG
ncbi:MAG: lysoplasmalogenase [Candidatus Lokiarchaeota archaeon]|nr:lysoplasmalogenase [Candidatus Lokiarchaeota archaeon]